MKSYIDGELVGINTGIPGILTYSFANRTMGRFGTNTTYYANGWIDDGTNIRLTIRNNKVVRVEKRRNPTKRAKIIIPPSHTRRKRQGNNLKMYVVSPYFS
jgi:hypothetical protein